MKRLIFALAMAAAGAAMAVEPDEILSDPALEARARDISAGLRCPVCRNESIDESNAGVSRDLRLLVRERLLAGDDNGEVVDYVVARYGEYVLLRPNRDGANILLWLAGPALLLVGVGAGIAAVRRKRVPQNTLSDAEQKALDDILKS